MSDGTRSDPIRAKATLALAAVYLLALGLLGGILVERVRFDRSRAAVLERYDTAVRDWKAERMGIELDQARDRAAVSPVANGHARRVGHRLQCARSRRCPRRSGS